MVLQQEAMLPRPSNGTCCNTWTFIPPLFDPPNSTFMSPTIGNGIHPTQDHWLLFALLLAQISAPKSRPADAPALIELVSSL
jgi:hypothetical protein